MSLFVYWGSGSQYSWRVLLALEIKRVPYESRLLEFSKREHKTPEHLARSPRGTVPAIEDDGFKLSESLAILAYLEAKHPEPPLFGRAPQETGTIWRIVSEYTHNMDDAVEKFVIPLYFGRGEEKAEQVKAAAERLEAELGGHERQLGESAYLAGERLTAADIVVYPSVKAVLRAAGKPAAGELASMFLPFAERYPRLTAWCTTIEQLPGYERTYPPHWR